MRDDLTLSLSPETLVDLLRRHGYDLPPDARMTHCSILWCVVDADERRPIQMVLRFNEERRR